MIWYLFTCWRDFSETWHKYSSLEGALLKRFSRSEVKVVPRSYDNNNNNNNLRLIMIKTNHSTLHTVYNIQQSATQSSSDTTHRLSCRTATTTRFSPEGTGCQKQTAPRFCQHPIRWAFTSQTLTRWRHRNTHPINRSTTERRQFTPQGRAKC